MKKCCWICTALVLVCGQALAIGKSEVRDIILQHYPGAKITEIEREIYRGQKIFEIDFQYEGEKLEAIIGLDGEIISVHIDD